MHLERLEWPHGAVACESFHEIVECVVVVDDAMDDAIGTDQGRRVRREETIELTDFSLQPFE